MKDTANKTIEITARAPGKIILSGEHAVIYAKKALAMAVDRFAEASVSSCACDKICFEFLDNGLTSALSLHELRVLREKVNKQYQDFIFGKCEIGAVLRNPLELIQYAFIYLAENILPFARGGLKIKVKTMLPVGCGMGASAAVIMSLIHAMVSYFGISLAADKYLYFGREIENLQHGKSSGLDLFLSMHGGCYFLDDGTMHKRALPKMPIVLVNTGKPACSTGECVSKCAAYFEQSDLGDDFSENTMVMDLALQQNNLPAVQECVRENHRLLKYIGVVPKKVADFIDEIEDRGGAAKISGAGAVYGDNAGIVLIVGDVVIFDLVSKYGYEVLQAEGEISGVQIV